MEKIRQDISIMLAKSKAVLDALESDDPVAIKAIRGSQLGNLTRKWKYNNRNVQDILFLFVVLI